MPSIQERMELNFRLEQFYFREARLLDERLYQEWLPLIAEDCVYTMPSRYTPFRETKLRGTQEFLAVEDELEREGSDKSPMREENFFTLALRVDRCFKMNSWGDNPPARTTRQVSNVEVLEVVKPGEYRVTSNFHLFYSRHGRDNYHYTGKRKDTLRVEGEDIKIAKREIILDWGVIDAPTVGLFF